MSRILRRPMFRGGPVSSYGTGIATGLGYNDGGRVGLAFGGDPMMPAVAEAPKEEVQDLSYTELRSRLPQEISNDIVQLLANSKQALMDFANIQTQQDVDNFNQTYNVNLVLPQEG